MLAHRLRRWTNIKPALVLGGVLAGILLFAAVRQRHRLLQVRASTAGQLETLHKIYQRSQPQVDFWSAPRSTHRNVTVSVDRRNLAVLQRELYLAGLHTTVASGSVQDLLDEVQRSLRSDLSQSDRFSLNEYNTFSDAQTYLADLVSSCDRCQIINIGQSFEGRDLNVVKIRGGKISAADSRGSSGLPAIWIDAGVHAREWISPATALNIINKLVNLNQEVAETRDLMDSYDWYILPFTNPDGYDYTWTNDRLWRKTRSTGNSDYCDGVDANRNWNYHWMEGGASADPCSNTYAGPRPFSEPETVAVSRFLRKRGDRFLVYFSLHAYTQLFLTSWSYTTDLPDDYDDLLAAAEAAVTAIREYSGKEYIAGSASNVIYVASGSSMDWAKGVAGIKYSYAAELRDRGLYGFLLPESEIYEQGEEIWRAMRGMLEEIESRQDAK